MRLFIHGAFHTWGLCRRRWWWWWWKGCSPGSQRLCILPDAAELSGQQQAWQTCVQGLGSGSCPCGCCPPCCAELCPTERGHSFLSMKSAQLFSSGTADLLPTSSQRTSTPALNPFSLWSLSPLPSHFSQCGHLFPWSLQPVLLHLPLPVPCLMISWSHHTFLTPALSAPPPSSSAPFPPSFLHLPLFPPGPYGRASSRKAS